MRTKFLLIFFILVSAVSQGQVRDTLIEKLQQYNRAMATRADKSVSLKDTVKVDLLREIALRNYDKYPEETLKYLQEQEELSRELEYNIGLAGAYEMKANVYEVLRQYDKALQYGKKSLELYIGEDSSRTIDVLNNLGILYSKQGIYTEALKFHLRALDYSEKYKDIYGFISSYNNIGILYASSNKPDLALKYYFKCLNMQLTKPSGMHVSYTYQNIGELYRNMMQYDNALKYLNKGVEAATREDEQLSLANCYSTISAVYVGKGQYSKALAANEKADKLRRDNDDDYGLFTTLVYYSDIYHKMGDNTKALYFAQKAAQHVEGHGELDMHKEAFSRLATINAELGNFEAAYINQGLYKKYSDSIFNEENQKKLVEQQLNFDFKRKEAEALEALQRQKYIKNYTVGGLSLIAVVCIFLLVRRYRQKARQKKMEYKKGIDMLQGELDVKEVEAEELKLENENIQLKNRLIAAENEMLQEKFDYNKRELASVMLYASQKNDLLAGLRNEVDTLREGKLSAAQIDKLKSVIHQNSYLDADWDKFKLHFEQVHPDFFKQLKVEHPGLTAYEVRLYTYLHMSLSTKEIAGLLNITPASVIKAKVRLNKKLNRRDDDMSESA